MTRAERKAFDLLASGNVKKPPVPIERLARLLDASIVYEHLDAEVSGALYRLPERVVIAVNKGHAATRKRFTIAHELGHLVLHLGRPLIVDHLVRAHVNLRDHRSSLATEKEEIEANAFAANLLMPKPFVHREIARLLARESASEQTIDDLATRFEVSPQAMDYRLTNLGLRSTLE